MNFEATVFYMNRCICTDAKFSVFYRDVKHQTASATCPLCVIKSLISSLFN